MISHVPLSSCRRILLFSLVTACFSHKTYSLEHLWTGMGPSETDYDPLLADGRLAIETSISKHRDNQGRCSWHKITWGVLICITLLSVYGFLFTTTRQTTLTEERAKLISEISRLKSQQSRFGLSRPKVLH